MSRIKAVAGFDAEDEKERPVSKLIGCSYISLSDSKCHIEQHTVYMA